MRDKNLQIKLTDNARNEIIERGDDPVYGARPLKRYVSRTIETLIAQRLIEDQIHYGDIITIDYQDQQFVLGVEHTKEDLIS